MAERLLLIFLSLAMVFGVGASDQTAGAPFPAKITALELRGLENAFALSTNLFSGASPEGDEGFAALDKLGVKTILTVDGTQPDVERAHAHGMRYIHLPHGYDGIPRATQLQLIKAIETATRPIYIHCHHGKHRGPAAAAVICMAELNWTPIDAEAWLRRAGAGTNFHGLYETVRNFQRPSAAEIAAVPVSFPESRRVSDLVDSMVSIDQTFDRLKTLRTTAASLAPDNHLVNEANLLREYFREAQRLPDAQKRGPDLVKGLREAEDQVATFEQTLLSSSEIPAVERAFKALAKSCTSCHSVYRDKAGASPLPR